MEYRKRRLVHAAAALDARFVADRVMPFTHRPALWMKR